LPNFFAHVRKLLPWALVLFSASVAVAAYLPALHYPLISDDNVYLTENTKLSGLHLIETWRLFIEPYNRYSEFLPLRELSYWFDMTLFGLNSSELRLHNIILYLLCLPLVYATSAGLWRYFRPASDAASAPWSAAVVTALFALNPSHVETVVWIAARKDVLSTLFSLLALWLALEAKREHGLSMRYAVATLLAFLAAMLSKASVVAVASVIAMLWVVFWWNIPTLNRQRSMLLWPFAIMLLAVCTTVVFATTITTRLPLYFGAEAAVRSLAILGWLTRLSVSPESRHFFYPVFGDSNLSIMVVIGGVVLLAAVSVVVVAIQRRRLSLEGFSVITFFLLCIPSLQLIPYPPPSLVSDRFLALAVWPIILLIVSLLWHLKPLPRTSLLLALALSWGFQTMERPRDWHSYEALIDNDIRAYPGYYMPVVYKIILFQLPRGLRSDAIEMASGITDAEFRDAMTTMIKINQVVHVDSVATGMPQDAMNMLWQLGLDIKKLPAQAKWNPLVYNALRLRASVLKGEWEFLAKQFPDEAPVRYNTGMWLLKNHNYKEAIVHLRASAQSQRLPESARGAALGNLGFALIESGNVVEAEMPLRAALEQLPPDYRAYCSLAVVYRHKGQIGEAEHAQAECRKLAPNDVTQ
jgi:hypothetical protein